ncbi:MULTISPECIES: MFS transporter [unclassified Streptomyces]|uniref:MFS transporter n=1 Tax=unclassified Streptomyces TaxID=2593676 RepID=UPI002254C7BE|nr:MULTISPECIES: aromatic acid/H+ symport family MFS transporter [unclassified Streptomyces]MCX4793657.1 aromatic acid/H+ symport family MFS transporter [Streptomyces sp. NBC_01242]WSP61524.1 aromatic acid/H+ symport family MFS transporter [Streptomyces sp. NBC_01240]
MANNISTQSPARSGTASRSSWTVILCWITVLLEGYDLVVLGAIIPTLLKTHHLGMTAGDATTIATLSLVGVAIGAVCVGPLADRLGRRLLLIGSVVLFSVFTILVPLADSVAMFAALRLIAGLGLGACMPVSLTMMSEHMPAHRRARASTLTMTGYHTGAVITSLLALQVTDNWQVLFYALGVAGLGIAAIQWFRLPESDAFVQAKEAPKAQRVAFTELLKPNFLRASIGIWVASFMGLLLVYGLNTWLPKLMNDAGYPVPTAVTQLLVLNVGGVVGLVLGGYVADRRGIKGTTLGWFAVSVLMLACLSIKISSDLLLNTIIFFTGVFVFSAQVLVYAYVTNYYPASVRGTALGSASGIGRIGSIVGPSITGALVTAGIGHPWGFYFFAAVAVFGFLAVLTLPRGTADAQPKATVSTA